MCDVCPQFSQLLLTCEERLTADASQYPTLRKSELEVVLAYIVSWPQRQCMCCYRDIKNFERFNLVIQSILCLSICQLKQLKDELESNAQNDKPKDASEGNSPTTDVAHTSSSKVQPDDEKSSEKADSETSNKDTPKAVDEVKPENDSDDEPWTMGQREKLMHIISKIFLINFPLYVACKHSAISRIDDLSAQEISNLSCYCDLHDTEIPVYLLRNVNLFCKSGGVVSMTAVFEHSRADTLPLAMAHAMVAIVGNLKLWLNFRAVSQLFMPLRNKILKFMCSLDDKDLRLPVVKTMADFMWGATKEPLESPVAFDGDGLSLAFKYFSSTTLTMRLAGVAQINAHIAAYNELCAGDAQGDAELAGQQLAHWLNRNNIMDHLFGPNLHVEVIKQSHMILKFLAVESCITAEHIELVWQAAQLKHCGRQVYDLLPGFIRALSPRPCAHLYSLLCSLPPREHTEQSLYLASSLMRVLWSRGASPLPPAVSLPCKVHRNSSSEASVSMDQSNSDEDPGEELSTSGEEIGPTPRKQSKQQAALAAAADWMREEEEPSTSKKEGLTLKPCQKRSKHAGSSGSSGPDESRRPRKKKLYRKRHKHLKTGAQASRGGHFLAAEIAKVELGEMVESVSEAEVEAEESSGSEGVALRARNLPCAALCDNIDPRRLMELRLLEAFGGAGVTACGEGEGEEGGEGDAEGSLSSASAHSDKHTHDLDEEADEDSACEEELARLAAQAHCLSEFASASLGRAMVSDSVSASRRRASPATVASSHTHTPHADDVCKPGNTLLWDLLQDGCIELLGEGLALEAEKALCALLCFSTDKFIRVKFIEGCLENLANHRSVAVSLRLMPKLFSSFQQIRGMDMHQVVMWAERERGMMRLFMEELRHYTSTRRLDAPPHAHITEVTVRLQFLTTIFSPLGSPANFRLSIEQVDTLWRCLTEGDAETADCLYSWLLSHTKSADQHALGVDALRFLYVEKMPTLDPQTISIMGLSLYQQLCNLARMALGQADSKDQAHSHILAMDHLWKIALRANSTDVSMGAIQYLNSYYMGQQLQQEEDFVSQCMSHLAAAAERLVSKETDSSEDTIVDVKDDGQKESKTDKKERGDIKKEILEYATEEAALQCIQRALLLLKTHLDTFKRRYAYHLRRWALAGAPACGSNGEGATIRVLLQPAGAGPRASLTARLNDYVAELRAQVYTWWEQQSDDTINTLGDGPLRMITQGQELTIDYDERTLYDMGFKDNQLVFVSVGVSGTGRSKSSCGGSSGGGVWGDWPSQQPPPPRASLPTLLLLEPRYFQRLFSLMQTLGEMTEPRGKGEPIGHMKAQLLSRRVWDILQAVPLNPTFLEAFQHPTESKLPELLDPSSPQKLMYSLHIVDKLSCCNVDSPVVSKDCMGTACSSESDTESSKAAETESVKGEKTATWNEMFILKGGLRHLYDIMMSGVLQRSEDGSGGGEESEWRQDCLALLLQLLCRLGATPANIAGSGDPQDPMFVPVLHESLLSLMDVETTTRRLMSILCEAATPRDPTLYKTGFWGRAQVVQHCMRLAVWWARGGGGGGGREGTAAAIAWRLRECAPRLLLEDADPAVRREAGAALYRLCVAGSTGTREVAGAADVSVAAPLLQLLLEYLPRAESMRPAKPNEHGFQVMPHHVEEGKEAYGPACRDYFWLVCRLIDGLPEEFFKDGALTEDSGAADLNALCERVRRSLESREAVERRGEPVVPDDGLYGQLSLLTHLLKHPLAFKTSEQGKKLLIMVFGFLFEVANPMDRSLPKCKSQKSRAAAYDLLVELVRGAPENYMLLHNHLMEHHKPGPHSPYPWDYWPAEESRSECGYVGLTNLGATCYMASCMQHLYMMPEARRAVLGADPATSKHSGTLIEMQRMFAYLLESERKAYNPRSFCKMYQMDHQPLNTGEQKDMAEFFIDLVSKLEEMSPHLKSLVKTLFCGVISNNVVSLDCSHVSRTLEEFYTVRCQVADMRNLHQSLDEVTVKDTLEGDNCYTCSQCEGKVRAEKRACFKKLPQILCFNTMRYTFNMLTMLKEKVNTHFSFPMRLDMSGYVEKHLMPAHYQEEKKKSEERRESEGDGKSEPREDEDEFNENYEYELIGVTVHTGTADGGHYYSFIRDRAGGRDRWLLFNDAEVKSFDPAHIAAECFGGEMTSKTYDSVTDKFMDFSFEKTNSAYMLFYEWTERAARNKRTGNEGEEEPQSSSTEKCTPSLDRRLSESEPIQLPDFLQKWIWDDNMQFLHDKNIFQHAYFTFMGQMCSYVPQSLIAVKPEITQVAAQLSTTFFIETFIHAKEKPTMVSWVELVTKQFNASAAASEWFMAHMADDTWWPMQVLIKCPNQMVRQMFQRLCMHVIQRLRTTHYTLYMQGTDSDDSETKLGDASCVTRFIRMLLSLMETGARSHLRNLTEYFSLLYDFSRMGEEETRFLLKANAISSMVAFYLGHTSSSSGDGSSSDEGGCSTGADKLRPGALDKMVALVAGLVERSREPQEGQPALSEDDAQALHGCKGFPFIYQQTRDCLNLQQTKTLIFALCRFNERLAQHIVNMIFQAVVKHSESCGSFFKLLTLLVEGSGNGGGATGGLPCFTQLALTRVWDAADACPHTALEWLALQVPRNKVAHAWALRTADQWLERHLLAASVGRVRAAAALLLVALVPSAHFRQGYARAARAAAAGGPATPSSKPLSDDAHAVLHQVYTLLLGKLKAARKYVDIVTHGTMKLTAYFGVMSYCVVSKNEKTSFGPYFRELWELYHPGISEPSAAVHPNKQALLSFWYTVSLDCPENVQMAVSNAQLCKHIAFNYILADHEDAEVIAYNRAMLPPYYALLRLFCQRSPAFARTLTQHQNVHWAFRNIAPHAHLYPAAADELLRLARLLATRGTAESETGPVSEQEAKDAVTFRKSTLAAYLQGLNGRTCWMTLISAFRTLVETDEDRLYVMYNGGLQMVFEAFHTLHQLYVESGGAGTSGVPSSSADLRSLLTTATALCRALRARRDRKEARAVLHSCKDWPESVRRISAVLHAHTPPDIRNAAIDLLKELVTLGGASALSSLVPAMIHPHAAARARPTPATKHGRSPRTAAHMVVPHGVLYNARKGEWTRTTLSLIYRPYHELVDVMVRTAISCGALTTQLVMLSGMLALEGVPLRFPYFATLWRDVANTPADRKYQEMILECSLLVEYMDAVLLQERETLEDINVYQFFLEYYPKVEESCAVSAVGAMAAELCSRCSRVDVTRGPLLGDVRALRVVLPRVPALAPATPPARALARALRTLRGRATSHHTTDSTATQDSEKAETLTDEQNKEPDEPTAAEKKEEVCDPEPEADLDTPPSSPLPSTSQPPDPPTPPTDDTQPHTPPRPYTQLLDTALGEVLALVEAGDD